MSQAAKEPQQDGIKKKFKKKSNSKKIEKKKKKKKFEKKKIEEKLVRSESLKWCHELRRSHSKTELNNN